MGRHTDMSFMSSAAKHTPQVRGANYLKDKKKIEAEGLEAELLNVDLVELEEKFWNIAEVLPAVTNSAAPFMFVMQARAVPTSPKPHRDGCGPQRHLSKQPSPLALRRA